VAATETAAEAVVVAAVMDEAEVEGAVAADFPVAEIATEIEEGETAGEEEDDPEGRQGRTADNPETITTTTRRNRNRTATMTTRRMLKISRRRWECPLLGT